MPRQHEVEALGLGRQTVVKTKLAGEEGVCPGADRVTDELPSRSADDRDTLYPCRWVADYLNCRRRERRLDRSCEIVQSHRCGERADATGAGCRRWRALQQVNVE